MWLLAFHQTPFEKFEEMFSYPDEFGLGFVLLWGLNFYLWLGNSTLTIPEASFLSFTKESILFCSTIREPQPLDGNCKVRVSTFMCLSDLLMDMLRATLNLGKNVKQPPCNKSFQWCDIPAEQQLSWTTAGQQGENLEGSGHLFVHPFLFLRQLA